MSPRKQHGVTAAAVKLLVMASGLVIPAIAAANLPTCTSTFFAELGGANVAITSVADTAAAGANPEYCDVVAALQEVASLIERLRSAVEHIPPRTDPEIYALLKAVNSAFSGTTRKGSCKAPV